MKKLNFYPSLYYIEYFVPNMILNFFEVFRGACDEAPLRKSKLYAAEFIHRVSIWDDTFLKWYLPKYY